MALEAGTYVNDLVSTNPVGSTDFVSQGDDHIRLLKSVLKTTFPNATRPFYLPTTVALQTATVNVLAADQSKIIPVSCEAAARTVNLPANAGIPDGYQVTIVKADHSPNMLTIDGNGSDTINGALTVLLWQRFTRTDRTQRRTRQLLAAYGAFGALLSLAMTVVVVANATTAADPLPGLEGLFAGTW